MARAYSTVTRQALHFFVRPHERVPDAPVRCTAAWRAADLADRSPWITALDADDVEEIEAGLAHARRTGKPLAALGAADLPLPTFGPRIARWRRAVADGLGVQVIRGLPVARWSADDCERFFWCFGHHLGQVGAQNRDDELLGHVVDQGLSYADRAVRGYKTAAQLRYHCDAADAVGLLCLRPAKAGGKSRLVSSVTVWNQLARTRPDLAALLFEPLAFDTRGDGGVDFFTIAPCRYADGVLRTFYHADYFRTAERQPGAPQLTARQRELLDVYDAIASDPLNFVELDFAAGDIQLVSNHTVLHARSEYQDYPEPERKRHLLRLWLSFDRRRPLRTLPGLGREAARLLAALGVGRLRKRLRS